MKKFREILSEVAQPLPRDELNFKNLHTIKVTNYPADVENQFTSHLPKAMRIADKSNNTQDVRGVNINQNDLPGQRGNDVNNDGVVDDMDTALKFHRKLQNRYKIIDSYNYTESLDPVGQEDDDIDNDGKSNTKSDKYLKHRRSARGRAIMNKIKNENFGPVTPAGGEYDDETTHREYKKGNKSPKLEKEAIGNVDEASNPYAIGMSIAKKVSGDEPPLEKSTINKAHKIAKAIKNEATSKMCKECDDPMTYSDNDNGWKCPSCGKTLTESEEAFSAGTFELDDGTNVEFTTEHADALNFLFNNLNEANRETMTSTLFENEDGFENIMTFAIEAIGDGSTDWKGIVKTKQVKKEAIGDGSAKWTDLVKAKNEETRWDPDTKQDREVSHFNIVHRKSGNVVGKASTYKRARNAMDKHDNNYGSYAHAVVPVWKQGN